MVRELRSHMPLFVSKKKKILIKNKTQLSIIIANTYIGPTISQTLFRGKKYIYLHKYKYMPSP